MYFLLQLHSLHYYLIEFPRTFNEFRNGLNISLNSSTRVAKFMVNLTRPALSLEDQLNKLAQLLVASYDNKLATLPCT